MKKSIITIILMLSVIILSGCQNKTSISGTNINQDSIQVKELSCNELSGKLDTTSLTFNDCQAINSESIPSKNMVGGTLLNINETYDKAHSDYFYILTFQGKDNAKAIYITAKNESDFNKRNLQIGKFYEFDMSGICYYYTSMANSGVFHGDFTEKECN